MKSLFIFALLCIALTNAFYVFSTSDSDLQILANANNQGNNNIADFNEIEALSSFLKGILKGAARIDSKDTATCLKGDGPLILFEFYYGLALAAGTSGQTSALDATRNYLSSIGARHIKRLPSDFVQCLTNTNDYKSLVNVLKVDPTSQVYSKAFSSMATSNPTYFQTVFSDIYMNIVAGKFYEAGVLYGTYAKIASLQANKK